MSLRSNRHLYLGRIHVLRWHLLVLICVPLLASANDYRFTFTNPSVGEPHAPYVLHYFSLVDCSPCRQFETQELERLMGLVNDGSLRIVFRDLIPDESTLNEGRWLFCLQEHPNYIQNRLEAKRSKDFSETSLPELTGKAKARYQSCLSSESAYPILSHNKEAFDSFRFVGTPSFALYAAHRQGSAIYTWSRPIAVDDLVSAITLPPTRRY